MSFDRGDRTYLVSPDRMRAFGALTVAQRLAWVEQCSLFVRMAQAARRDSTDARAPASLQPPTHPVSKPREEIHPPV